MVMDKNNFKKASDAAAFLAEDESVRESVERESKTSILITALINMRIQKGYTQQNIADAMECTPSKISKMESGNDLNLKWSDVLAYLNAMCMRVSLMFDDESMPASSKIKQCVFTIHDQLGRLAILAEEVDGDTEITDKIYKFYGEVLFNFIARFEESYQRLHSVLRIPDSEVRTLNVEERAAKKNLNKKTSDPLPV